MGVSGVGMSASGGEWCEDECEWRYVSGAGMSIQCGMSSLQISVFSLTFLPIRKW